MFFFLVCAVWKVFFLGDEEAKPPLAEFNTRPPGLRLISDNLKPLGFSGSCSRSMH